MDSYEDENPIPNMDNHYDTLMEFLRDNDGMRAAASGSLQQGLWAGSGAITGGLLLGPVGGFIGGVGGSLVGLYYANKNSYQGVLQQIGDLEAHQRQRLVAAVRASLVDAGANVRNMESPEQFRTVLMEMVQQHAVRDQVWKACVAALE
jgi:hypothetical protein